MTPGGPDSPGPDITGAPADWRLVVLGVLVLVGLTALAYRPALAAGYVRFDDTDYVQENRLLRSPAGLTQLWTQPRAYPVGVPFYPITFSLHWLEYRLWGPAPAGYHAVSVGLHALNALLVWLLVRRLRLPGAYFAALLFALHPVQVQSVAWLAERKNVLAGSFYLLAALAALRHVRRGTWGAFAATIVLFALGLLSKPIVCTLPVALLICNGRPRGSAFSS